MHCKATLRILIEATVKTFVKEHKVLLVVDDAGSEENFNRLLKDTNFANGNKDSRMIVTCRNWQYLKKQAI
jgi:hypothetical protein